MISTCSLSLIFVKKVNFLKMLLKRYQNVHNPPEPMISPNLETVDDIIAPYTVESTGAQVTLTTAISLVNRFLSLFIAANFFKILVSYYGQNAFWKEIIFQTVI